MADIINLLPDAIANQIAAGEVVQRPASVVKELLENAIDSGASQIKLIVKEAGKSFIQVSDNGSGMSETDARMCFERHATSKINKIEDLFTIHTFGFRGEAMASIAAVARVELKTKRAQDALGSEVVVEDSRVKKHQACSTTTGTSTTVKNLFFNVPARKNFLKSDTVERRHIHDEFVRVALANPQVQMSYYYDNDELFHLTAGSLKQRIVQLFGKKYQETLIAIEEETDLVNIKGFVAKPEMAKKSKGEQFFFANNRYIKSPYFNHAIVGAFEGLISPDSYPTYFIFFEINPARIDVNVHPTKTEVKFEDEKSIYAIIRTTLKMAISRHNISPNLNFDAEANTIPSNPFDDFMKRHAVSNFSEKEDRQSNGNHGQITNTQTFKKENIHTNQSQEWTKLYEVLSTETEDLPESKQSVDADELFDLKGEEGLEQGSKRPFQINRKYVVSSISSGLVVVHQRLAHQRILYEKYFNMLQAKGAVTQQKLFPEVVQFNQNEFEALQKIEKPLKDMGFDFAHFGKNAILVNGFPADMNVNEIAPVFERFISYYLESEQADGMDKAALVALSLAKSSCLQVGTDLSPEAMLLLIEKLFACQMPYFTPEGQATLITLSTEELDKKFKTKR